MQEEVHIERLPLPGIGLRFDLVLHDGRRVGVVHLQKGGRELFITSVDDPDTPAASAHLSDVEATALCELLGGGVTTHELGHLQAATSSVAVDWVAIDVSSPYCGRPLAEVDLRDHADARIVAIVRDGTVLAPPDPSEELHPGDVLLVVGPVEELERAARHITTGD